MSPPRITTLEESSVMAMDGVLYDLRSHKAPVDNQGPTCKKLKTEFIVGNNDHHHHDILACDEIEHLHSYDDLYADSYYEHYYTEPTCSLSHRAQNDHLVEFHSDYEQTYFEYYFV